MRPVVRHLFLGFLIVLSSSGLSFAQNLRKEFKNPPREFSVMPFWFWNDSLKDYEIVHQIADFEAHGVYGFVIHPRIGLPDNIAWLSPPMIKAMKVAVEEAARRKMYVILYDEGMYPSGSSSGQVVARNPEHAAHGIAKIDLNPGDDLQLPEGANLINILNRSNGSKIAVIEKPSGGIIRGLHYIGEGSERLSEESPPAGDILNPDAVASFIELVYDRYYKEFGTYFEKTIRGIFTDEPSPLGRNSTSGMLPGNAALFKQINRILGYDFKPFLADLWYSEGPDWARHRADYNRAINICLDENYYRQISEWCNQHAISLMGHPAGSMDIGTEKYFQVPGQDLVWRYVEPGIKALEGEHSTMAKCASSAMAHLGYRRNAAELYGAYGHNLTWEEMLWLASWCFVRGQNLLIPHAFYYSIRGPRYNERPPDVGPNAEWWSRYKPFADACRRLSWINTDSRQVCEVAILGEADYLPYQAAITCYSHQIDFNYLEDYHILKDAKINSDGIHIAGMVYKALIIDSISFIPDIELPYFKKLTESGRLIMRKNSPSADKLSDAKFYIGPEELVSELTKLISPDINLNPASPGIRYRHVIKGNYHYYLLFNEEDSEVTTFFSVPLKGKGQWLDQFTAEVKDRFPGKPVTLKPFELRILRIRAK